MVAFIQNIVNGLRKILGLKPKLDDKDDSRHIDSGHLEPKYWPEVKHFMDNINTIIKTYTIDDDNIHIVNQRIIDYMAKEINAKGSIEDVIKRYDALNTLADRILVTNLSKIVGIKQVEAKGPDFSGAVGVFKKDLRKRYEKEVHHKSHKN